MSHETTCGSGSIEQSVPVINEDLKSRIAQLESLLASERARREKAESVLQEIKETAEKALGAQYPRVEKERKCTCSGGDSILYCPIHGR